jgi:hypothetical protein
MWLLKCGLNAACDLFRGADEKRNNKYKTVNHNTKKKKIDWFISIWFILLVSLPFLGSLFGWDFYERQNENRVMAVFPDIKTTSLAALPNKLEAFYNDNFGFRNTFIRKHRKLEKKWFGRTPSSVLEGVKEGWWFYALDGVVDDFMGQRNLTAAELSRWEAAITTRTKYLKEKGIPYIFMIMPNKIMIYPEYLPERIQKNRKKTRFEQLQKHMKDATGFTFSYPKNELLAAKNENDVYFPGDTHWNDTGGYIGYRHLIKELQKIRPSIQPIEEKDCTVEVATRMSDLAGILNGTPEQITLKRLTPADFDSISIERREDLISPSWTSTIRNPPTRRYNSKGTGTALVIHDSFYAQGIERLLPSHFEETYFFWMYASPEEVIDLVNRLNPDIVIEMRVERSLRHIPDQPRNAED